MFSSTLVNLDIFDLRCRPRIKVLLYRSTLYDMLILAISTFISSAPSLVEYSTNCFQSRLIGYNNFIDRNFDGTANKNIPLAQIYLSLQSSNETYILKKILKEQDKQKFAEAMEVGVSSISKEEIWVAVPKHEKLAHYNKMRADSQDIRRL